MDDKAMRANVGPSIIQVHPPPQWLAAQYRRRDQIESVDWPPTAGGSSLEQQPLQALEQEVIRWLWCSGSSAGLYAGGRRRAGRVREETCEDYMAL